MTALFSSLGISDKKNDINDNRPERQERRGRSMGLFFFALACVILVVIMGYVVSSVVSV